MAVSLASTRGLSVEFQCPFCTTKFTVVIGLSIYTEGKKGRSGSLVFNPPAIDDIITHLSSTHPTELTNSGVLNDGS